MKTFLLNIPNEIKNWSNSLDAKAVLTSRSWLVFNDEGVKEVYVFQKDGTLIASHDGKVTRATWEYIPVNSSIIIDVAGGEKYMLNPCCYDEKVLVLQLDGTNKFSVLIDQGVENQLKLDTFDRVSLYITNKEEYNKQAEEAKKQKQKKAAEKRERWNKFIDDKLSELLDTPECEEELNSMLKRRNIIVFLLAVLIMLFLIVLCLSKELLLVAICVIIFLIWGISVTFASNTKGGFEMEKRTELMSKYPLEKFEIEE